MKKNLYRMDWGLPGKAYPITEESTIFIERLDFSNSECIYTEDYRQITYKKYLALCEKNQIVSDYNKNGPLTYRKP